MVTPLPSNESARLTTLQQYEILDTLPEQAFDDLTRLAAHICGTPVALISLVDNNRQWFKSKVGLEASETPRDVAFCGYAILEPNLLIVPDASQDIRFADNPLVTGDPNIRFYAGVPLINQDGFALGTLCLIDYVPRDLSPEQREALQVLARQVMMQLELRRNLAALQGAITQHQQSEEALKESADGYRRLVELSPETIAVLSEDKFNYINTVGADLLGAASSEELIGKSILDFCQDWQTIETRVWQVQGKAPDLIEQKLVQLDGQVIDVEIAGTPIFYLGKPATQIMIRDITERKRTEQLLLRAKVAEATNQELVKEITERKEAEEALRESQRKLSTLINSLPGIVFSYANNPEWSMTYFSEGCLNLTGYTSEELMGNRRESYNSLTFAEDLPKILRAIETAIALEQPYVVEYRIRTKSGKEKWLWEKGSGVFNLNKEVLGVEGFITDITERKQAEEDIRKTLEKDKELTEIKSRFVTMTSQEFRNPLSTILSSAELLENYGHKWAEEKKLVHLQRIQTSVKQMADQLNEALRLNRGLLISDDLALIQAFVEGFVQGETPLLSNPNLSTELTFDTFQLIAKKEGLIAAAKLTDQLRSVMVKQSSCYWELIHQAMLAESFLPIEDTQKDGFYNYQYCKVPSGYKLHYTDAMKLWKAWRGLRNSSRLGVPTDLLILNSGTWSPFTDLVSSNGSLFIKTLGREVIIHGSEMLIWLQKLEEDSPSSKPPGTNGGRPGLQGYYRSRVN